MINLDNIFVFLKENKYIFIFSLIIFILVFFIIKKKASWKDDKDITQPFLISLFITLIVFAITLSMAIQTDEKIDDILYGDTGTPGTGNNGPSIDKAILSQSITPNGTMAFWTILNRPQGNYQEGYLFDIADSYIKNRMSLFVDGEGFLTWRIVDEDYNIHVLRADINEFLNGTRFFIALTWNTDGTLIIYINGIQDNKIKLDQLNINIKSTDMYFGSDIDGRNNINMNLPKITYN